MGNKRTEIQSRYDKENTRRFSLKYNIKTDSDILSHLESQSSVHGSIQGYIKQLIRADIAAQAKAAETQEER